MFKTCLKHKTALRQHKYLCQQMELQQMEFPTVLVTGHIQKVLCYQLPWISQDNQVSERGTSLSESGWDADLIYIPGVFKLRPVGRILPLIWPTSPSSKWKPSCDKMRKNMIGTEQEKNVIHIVPQFQKSSYLPLFLSSKEDRKTVTSKEELRSSFCSSGTG